LINYNVIKDKLSEEKQDKFEERLEKVDILKGAN